MIFILIERLFGQFYGSYLCSKARIFLLDDLQAFFFRFMFVGDEKK